MGYLCILYMKGNVRLIGRELHQSKRNVMSEYGEGA